MNVTVTGPEILFEIPLFGGIPVTETIVNMWILMGAIVAVCIWLTRNMQLVPKGKQIVAELLVESVQNMVKTTMGEKFSSFAPYIATLLGLSALSSLSSLWGMRPPTADLSVTLAWALVTFIMVQSTKIKHNGFFGYLKGFTEPVIVMTPLNIIGEVATPVSMSFRHFGNIAAGTVITSLVYAALAGLSSVVLGIIPNAFLSSIPIFQLGIPAVLSIYFDLFTSVLQAYIFCMLTMVFVSSAAE